MKKAIFTRLFFLTTIFTVSFASKASNASNAHEYYVETARKGLESLVWNPGQVDMGMTYGEYLQLDRISGTGTPSSRVAREFQRSQSCPNINDKRVHAFGLFPRQYFQGSADETLETIAIRMGQAVCNL